MRFKDIKAARTAAKQTHSELHLFRDGAREFLGYYAGMVRTEQMKRRSKHYVGSVGKDGEFTQKAKQSK